MSLSLSIDTAFPPSSPAESSSSSPVGGPSQSQLAATLAGMGYAAYDQAFAASQNPTSPVRRSRRQSRASLASLSAPSAPPSSARNQPPPPPQSGPSSKGLGAFLRLGRKPQARLSSGSAGASGADLSSELPALMPLASRRRSSIRSIPPAPACPPPSGALPPVPRLDRSAVAGGMAVSAGMEKEKEERQRQRDQALKALEGKR